jgi:hypothetical protein
MIAGATPKETKSDSESSTAPNLLETRSSRAARPSRASKTIASPMATTALAKHECCHWAGSISAGIFADFASSEKWIDASPEQSESVVITLGMSAAMGTSDRRRGPSLRNTSHLREKASR